MEIIPSVSATHGFARSLPAKLERLVLADASHGVQLREGEKKKINLLKDQLKQISEYLMEPSDVEFPASAAKCWVEEVRELSYDIDDFHDELVSNSFPKNPHGSKLTNLRGSQRSRWITSEISRFRIRLEKAIQRYKTYNLHECKKRQQSNDVTSSNKRPPPPVYGVEYARPVGIGDSMGKIQEWLTDEGEPNLRVVAVVGLGGVGKTTLANELYRNLGKQSFQCRAFVRSSQMPDMRKLLTSILLQVRPRSPVDVSESSNLTVVTDTIRTYLKHKKYFIVIDGLWALSTWDLIIQAFPDDHCSSRILITTEVDDVAHRCCGHNSDNIVRMEPLNKDWPRELFFSRFGGNQPEFSESVTEVASDTTYFLKEISSEILTKCGGFPLAIISISSLLSSLPRDKIEKWNYIWSSLSSNLKTNPTTEGMKQVLSLCYNSLPGHLKTCMLYLSIYNEEQIIRKDDLINQWIAEGFICEKEEKDKEEVASTYFDELVTMGMIQPVHNNHNGQVISCTVHYMVLQLIQCKSIEENFVITIHHSETNIRLGDKVRRLSLHFGDAEDAKPPDRLELSQVRTLAFYGLFRCMPSLAEFQLIRVIILDLWGDHDTIEFELPTVCKLGYLEIACNVTFKLQIKLQGLQYLETLKIDSRRSEVPEDIVHLPRLLHLSLPGETKLPNCIGHMSSLRTFGCFNLSSNSEDNVERLDQLTNLRDLRLTCSTMLRDELKEKFRVLSSVLSKLNSLQSLTLLPAENSSSPNILGASSSGEIIPCDHLLTVSPPPALLEKLELSPRICIFSGLPGLIGGLGNLSILKIAVREISSSDIDTLKSLHALSALLLYVKIAPPERIVFQEGFPVLKHFKFISSKLRLVFGKGGGAMPNVRRLKLGFNTDRLDQDGLAEAGLENLKSLSIFSAKIGYAGPREHGRQVKATLEGALSSGDRHPIINIYLVDRVFESDKEMSTMGKTDQHQTQKADAVITGGGGPSEPFKTGEKDSPSGSRGAGIRIPLLSDSSSNTENQGQDENTRPQKKKYQTIEEQGVIVEGDSHEQPAIQNGSGEDTTKQADSRASLAPEHFSLIQTKPFSGMQSQDQDKNMVTQEQLHEATNEQQSDSRVSISPEGFDLEGLFGQIEGRRDLNQTSELLTPQIDTDHPEAQEWHQPHTTTKSPEKQSGLPENSPNEDKSTQFDRRNSAVHGSSSYVPISGDYINEETQQDAYHGTSEQYGTRKNNKKLGYVSHEREGNVAKEQGDSRDNTAMELSFSSLYPGWTKWRLKNAYCPGDTALGIKYLISQYMKQERFRAKNGIASIKQQMELMTIIIAENKENGPGTLPEKWVIQLQDLVHDIEDFIDVYNWLHKRSWRHTLAHMSHIVRLNNRIKILREWQQNAIPSKNEATAAPSGASAVSSPDYAPQGVFIGMDSLRAELLQMFLSDDDGLSKPKVISVVGPRGVGKTALARSVCYDKGLRYNFDTFVWVVASKCSSAGDLLSEICKSSGSYPDSGYNLKYILQDRRYLVVIDDLQQSSMWHNIQDALAGAERGSRIMVTTSIQSVAAACSPESYIIRMHGLDRSGSQELFMRTLGGQLNPTPAQEHALQRILHQCGGLPVAVISAANYLRGQQLKNLTEGMAKIGNDVACTPGALEGMSKAFTKEYNSLPDSVHRTCLLSLGTFPTGHLINRKSLIRGWIAEGLVVGDVGLNAEKVADNCFDDLIDRHIIEPESISINSKVKRCRVNGFLQACIVNRSICKNFVTLVRGDEPLRNGSSPVRRLSVHGSTTASREVAMEMGLNHVRSLTISRGVPLNFRACGPLRVLDMEGCYKIDDGVLTVICSLVLLKYLSLRDTDVRRIPRAISNLSNLETLDTRKTGDGERAAVKLPIDVFLLPRLAHLFGRFELPQGPKDEKKRKKMQRFFSEKSRLHTLSGFIMGEDDYFVECILPHMKRLRKLKIWCQSYDILEFDHLVVSSLHVCLTGNNALESLSIDIGDRTMHNYFDNIEISDRCMLSSMKLRGRLPRVPSFFTSPANNLSELQLFSTGLPLREISDVLQSLRQLLYLKLAEDGDGFRPSPFAVERDGFPSLERLCFEAPILPHLHIRQGAMPALTSLQLICPEIDPFRSRRDWDHGLFGTENLKNLNELVLHPSVSDEDLDFWKEKAMRHRNRPKVTRQPMP